MHFLGFVTCTIEFLRWIIYFLKPPLTLGYFDLLFRNYYYYYYFLSKGNTSYIYEVYIHIKYIYIHIYIYTHTHTHIYVINLVTWNCLGEHKIGFCFLVKTFPPRIYSQLYILILLSRNNFESSISIFAKHFAKYLYIDHPIYSHYYSMRYILIYTF